MALLSLPLAGGFPSQWPVIQSFSFFVDSFWSNLSSYLWFEMPWRLLEIKTGQDREYGKAGVHGYYFHQNTIWLTEIMKFKQGVYISR